MAASGFIPNPGYIPEFRSALAAAIAAKGKEAQGYAQADASWSQSIPGTIQMQMLTPDTAIVGFASGSKGFFFEHGTEPRYTKSGAYRGIGPTRPILEPASDQAMSTPLALVI